VETLSLISPHHFRPGRPEQVLSLGSALVLAKLKAIRALANKRESHEVWGLNQAPPGTRLPSPEVGLLELTMKPEIHPNNPVVTVACACGTKFQTRSTRGEDLSVDICSECHPFYTGKQRLVDTAGRIDRFRKKFNLPSA
jgi:large subunit ribosomal protein L31